MKDGVLRPPNSVDTTSKSLLKRIKSGDQAAWQQLVFLYGPIVSFWINRSKLQSDDARDVSQEVFLAIVRNIERFERTEGASKFRRWLKVITHSKIADHFRRLQRTNTVDAELRCDLDEQHRPDSFNFIHENDEGSVDENAVIAQSAVALIRPEFRENTSRRIWIRAFGLSVSVRWMF